MQSVSCMHLACNRNSVIIGSVLSKSGRATFCKVVKNIYGFHHSSLYKFIIWIVMKNVVYM